MKMNLRQNNAITLIALVITIIILLILAGVTIVALTGDNGLLNRAGEAKSVSDQANEIEMLEAEARGSFDKNGVLVVGTLNSNINSHIRGATTDDATTFPLKVTFSTTGNNYLIDEDGNVIADMPETTTPPTTAVAENTKYNDGTKTAVIPKGFRVSSNATEQTIDTGLVVYDGNNNEWVWIPVPDASVMYTTTGAPYTLRGSTGVKASMASKSEILSGKARTTPGKISSPYYKEPDLVTSYDNDATAQTAGFNNLLAMAQGLVKDYEEMIKSVEKYNGFYVGRYELTGSVTSPEEKTGVSLTNQNWYNLYKACKGFTVNGVVESRMIWGCQWDVICIFVADSNHDITDSRSWGNHNDSSENALISGKSGSKQNTGYSEHWNAKKIYDIAGNCYEWSQEGYDNFSRAIRGGYYGLSGNRYSASCFSGGSPNNSRDYYSTRPTLYIK